MHGHDSPSLLSRARTCKITMHEPESVDELCTGRTVSEMMTGKLSEAHLYQTTDTFMGTKSVESKTIFSASTTTAKRCYWSGRAYKNLRIVVSEFLSSLLEFLSTFEITFYFGKVSPSASIVTLCQMVLLLKLAVGRHDLSSVCLQLDAMYMYIYAYSCICIYDVMFRLHKWQGQRKSEIYIDLYVHQHLCSFLSYAQTFAKKAQTFPKKYYHRVA